MRNSKRGWPCARPIVAALKNLEVYAVVGQQQKIAILLLSEVEKRLRISDAAFLAMFELSGAGMIQADAPGFRFTRVNQRFCQISGYSSEELLDMTYIGLTHPEDRPRDMAEFAEVLRAATLTPNPLRNNVERKDRQARIRVGVHTAFSATERTGRPDPGHGSRTSRPASGPT